MARMFASLYSYDGKLYAVATDGTAWHWVAYPLQWVRLVPLPQEKTDG